VSRNYERLEVRRRQVRHALGGGPLRQSEIASAVGITQSAASKILYRMLVDGDLKLVKAKVHAGRGPWPMRYSLADQPCSIT
jgi:DNA-binding Lrp family transcriptional regulator